MALSTLATLAPSSPGYIGPFHFAASTAIVILGGEEILAAAFALIAHLCVWVPTTLLGIIAMLVNPTLFKRYESKMGD